MGVRRGFHCHLGTCLPTHRPTSSAPSPASRSSPRPGVVISPSPGPPRHCLPCSRISVGGQPMCCPPVRARFCPSLIRWRSNPPEGLCRGAALAGNWSSCQPAMLRAQDAISTQPLSFHLFDSPTADLQALGQFPLAHSLRPFHLDVLSLSLGQARLPARETPLGPHLRLARDRALPDRVSPPFAEGEHHRELELAVGRGRVKFFRQGPELLFHPVQTLDHLQPAGKPCKRRR